MSFKSKKIIIIILVVFIFLFSKTRLGVEGGVFASVW